MFAGILMRAADRHPLIFFTKEVEEGEGGSTSQKALPSRITMSYIRTLSKRG